MQAACSSQLSRTLCRRLHWVQATHSALKPSWSCPEAQFLQIFRGRFRTSTRLLIVGSWLWAFGNYKHIFSIVFVRMCAFSVIFWVWEQRRNSRDGCSVSTLREVSVLATFTLSRIYVRRNWLNPNLYITLHWLFMFCDMSLYMFKMLFLSFFSYEPHKVKYT